MSLKGRAFGPTAQWRKRHAAELERERRRRQAERDMEREAEKYPWMRAMRMRQIEEQFGPKLSSREQGGK